MKNLKVFAIGFLIIIGLFVYNQCVSVKIMTGSSMEGQKEQTGQKTELNIKRHDIKQGENKADTIQQQNRSGDDDRW
jgi:hypothetical protein